MGQPYLIGRVKCIDPRMQVLVDLLWRQHDEKWSKAARPTVRILKKKKR